MKPYVLHEQIADGSGFVIAVNSLQRDEDLARRLFAAELEKISRPFVYRVPMTHSHFHSLLEIGGGYTPMFQIRCRGIYTDLTVAKTESKVQPS